MKLIIILGPPGVGKGTQSVFLAETFNLMIISMGDLLRRSIAAHQDIAKGNLVPDANVSSLLEDRIIVNNEIQGYLIDGYPRTLSQVKYLDDLIFRKKIQRVYFLHISLDEDFLMKRLISRFVCKACKRVYNHLTAPTKIRGICDFCQGGNFFVRWIVVHIQYTYTNG